MVGTRAAYRMSHSRPGVGRGGKDAPDGLDVCEHRGAVFEAHGKRLEYAKNSLYVFDEHNAFRVGCAKIISHPYFDRVILLFILLNSVVLALTDWSVIDEDPGSDDVGEPIEEGSWRNTLLYESEVVFTVCFTTEFVLKVIAQGFFLGQGSYLRDPWNDLDFVVVVTALLTSIPNMPKMTAIRVFRVLRPLRSVSALPGLQKLVVSMLRSVPQLVSVVVLLQFIFTVFGIFGIQIFAGKQHSRCRLTPHPVTTDFEIGMNHTEYRCIDAINFDSVDDEPSWSKRDSPWATSRECWWPLDLEDERLCAFDTASGNHKCDHDPMFMEESDFRWCGSNYDALGNQRFSGGVIEGVVWGAKELTENATYVESLNWGYTTFDNIFVAFLSIFQSITLEGWSEILYQVKDCSLPILGDLFFIILVLWGSFFTLNLLLAVLEVNFSQGKEDDKEAGEERKRQASIAEEQEALANGGEPLVDDNGTANEEKAEEDEEGGTKALQNSETVGYPAWRLALYWLVSNQTFQHSITALIVANTVVLSLDHHPMDDEFSTILEALNFSFTLSFVLEMALKLLALGPKGYAKDRFNLFDGFIVLSSIIELIVSPPDILTGESGGSSGGGLSALRSFRVFRIFKLARDWHSMRELLETLHKTLLDIGNFGLLLLLFMYIYVLIGLQFFANRFHFDDDGHVIGIGEEGYDTADVPRSNFDTLLNAFVTIFEILSGENWNAVMYNARRATSWVSVFYFITLIVMGMMIVMSLFLAILLSNFNTEEEDADPLLLDDEDSDRPLDDSGNNKGDGATRLSKAEGGRAEQEEGEHVGDAKVDDADEYVGAGGKGAEDNGTSLSTSSGGPQRAPSHRGPRKAETSSQTIKTSYDSESGGSGRGKGAGVGSGSGSGSGNGVEKPPPSGTPTSEDDGKDVVVGKVSNSVAARVKRKLEEMGADVADYCVASIRTVRVPDNIDPGRALFLLGPKNPVRRRCSAVVTNPGFDRFTLVLIGISSIALALDNPLRDPDSRVSAVLDYAEVVLTVLFSLEMAFKVLAYGFVCMPGAYLRSSWNILDFLVVVVSVVQLTADDAGGLGGLRSLRALRALRPLRLINRMPGLKLVLEALIASIPGVLNVAAVCLMFFVIFAILGVNYFKGILMSCQGEEYDALSINVTSFVEQPLAWSTMSAEQQAWFGPLSNVTEAFSVDSAGDFISAGECSVINGGWPDSSACCSAWPATATEAPTSFQVCECLGLDWDQTIPQQFDNVAVALLTFFEISTTEAWTAVTYAAIDATSEDMQPIRDKNLIRVWFFILFMLFGAYLVMNLFVGVVVDNFKKMKTKVEGSGVLVTEAQQSWIKTQLIMRRLRPLKRETPPGHPIGDWCFRLAQRGWFDAVVMACIVLNTIIMAMEYFGQSDIYTTVLASANYAFFGIFTVEAVIKILAFRKAYFADPWNRFDFVIVIGSFLGMLMLLTVGSSYGSIATVIRVFRIGRVLRLVRGLESMAQLFNTLLLTLPSLGNVGALLCLLFFIYAAMGVQLFAKVGLSGAVDERANFQTFWDSMVLLLRFSTGENWNGFMYDMNADREGCVSSPEYDPDVCGFTDHANCEPLNGCGTWTIFPYMITFTLAITFVFMNLFIGVILDGFDAASSGSTDVITQEDFARFAELWAVYDPHATCLITVQDLHAFLQTLFEPWGFGSEYKASKREMRNKIRRLNLPIFEGNRVHFKDVLLALSEEVYRTNAEEAGDTLDLPEGYQEELAVAWQKQPGSGRNFRNFEYIVHPVSNEPVTLEHLLAVQLLQQVVRSHLERSRGSGLGESQNKNAGGDKRPSTPLARMVAAESDSLPPHAGVATKGVALEAQGGGPLAGAAELPRPMVQSASTRTVTTTLITTTNGDGGGGGGGGGGNDIAPSSDPGRGVERGGVDREAGSLTVTSREKWTVTETATSDAHPNRPRVVSSRSSFESFRSTLSSPGGVVEQQSSVQRWAVEAAAGETAGSEPGRRMAFSGTSTSLSLRSSIVSPREQGAPPLGERSELEPPREAGEEEGGGLAEAEMGSLPGQSSRRRDDSGENRH